MESKKRSLIKSLTYRVMATAILAITSWTFTSSVSETTIITIVFTVFATLGYYLHERIWARIKWELKGGDV